jgi:SulP family sulfate permease
MEKLKPKLFSVLKTYTREQFCKDVVAGIIVAIIALPLSIALALASGVNPEKGLYTAIVAGFVIAFLGGSRVQISGPTAAFATIVAGIVARNGFDGLVIATIMAGIILILMGLCRLGNLIKFIPYTITTGFTAGIAVTIVLGQIKDFMGLTFQGSPISSFDKLCEIFHCIGTINLQALFIGLISLAVLIIWPKINQKIPASLIAIFAAIAVMHIFHMKVNTIGSLYEISNKPPVFHFPSISFHTVQEELPNAITIAILASIESLLSCVVSDGMTGSRHRSNMELIAQGAGNICSGLFGGIPATGAIARTAANVKNGGRTPISGMVHSVVLLLILVILMPYAALIPMPAIAAILFTVAYNMSEWRTFVDLVKTSPKSDILVLFVTFFLTVVFDLVVAIECGIILASFLFLKRMSEETNVNGWKYVDDEEDDDPDSTQLKHVPGNTLVYEIIGPMFFGAADKIMEISTDEKINCIILRMHGVPAIDATAVNNLKKLYEKCNAHHITLILSHVNEQPLHAIQKAGFDHLIGEENFCTCIDEALERAQKFN